MPDNMSPAQRSRTMSRIRSTNTNIELVFRRLLHGQGFRYRIHYPGLPGRPDIVFTRLKVAIFVDGDFWHGWNFEQWGHKLSPAWHAKIARNRARDARNDIQLKEAGWTVLRIWEHELKADPQKCLRRVAKRLKQAEIRLAR